MLNHPLFPGCCLLQSGESLLRFIRLRYLLIAVEFISICIAVMVIFIYSLLYFKKKTHLYKVRLSRHLEVWISAMIFHESGESPGISQKFHRIVRNPAGRQFVIDELVACKKNFTGLAAKNIVALYEELGLKPHSFKKLGSRQWHIKAKGIQELYLMDQSDTLTRIYKNTNNKHELVRMEAQIGVLHLTGFDGLRFLDVISYPITEWQQLKLLEQLKHSKLTDKVGAAIPRWLQSPNSTVAQFALKLADEYQQLGLHDAVAACLQHPDEAVRRQAVRTLIRIGNETTPHWLTAHFPEETPGNKLLILDNLGKIASEEEVPFLTGLLDDEDNIIKLKAARALAVSSCFGLAILAEKSKEQPSLYNDIYCHVKSEIAL